MTDSFTVIIPARLGSTRLPGKVLLDIEGLPLLQHVFNSASASQAKKVYIAADDQRIIHAAEKFGASCVLTSDKHKSGSDRLAEAATLLNIPGSEIVVNVQGDEFGMPPQLIDQVARLLAGHPDYSMATLCEKMGNDADLDNPDIVKVVTSRFNTALYFSRLPVPSRKSDLAYGHFRHIGIYAYRANYLHQFTRLPVCDLERSESLEQLRALYNGTAILIEEACLSAGIGIDTEQDLARARQSTVGG